MENEIEQECAQCHENIREGDDLLELAQGVLGLRGFVPLKTQKFCGEKCLQEYFDCSDLEKAPSRTP